MSEGKRRAAERAAEYDDSHTVTPEEFDAAREEGADAPPIDQQMIGTSIRLPRPVMDRVREHASAQGLKPTAYMRQVIEVSVADEGMSIPLSVLLSAAIVGQYASSGELNQRRRRGCRPRVRR